jgi:hypothetical protein
VIGADPNLEDDGDRSDRAERHSELDEGAA